MLVMGSSMPGYGPACIPVGKAMLSWLCATQACWKSKCTAVNAGAAAFHAQQESQQSRTAAYEMANASRQGNADVVIRQTSHAGSPSQQSSHNWDAHDSGSRPAELQAERVRNGSNGSNGHAGIHVQHEQQQESQQRHANRGKDDTAAATQPNKVASHSPGDNGIRASSQSQRPASNGSEPTEQSSHGADDGEQQRDVPSHKSALEDQQNKQGIPHSWTDATVLQFLHEHSALSSEEMVEKLQMPGEFVQIDSSEEDCLVLAACRQSSMLSLFRAYAPHNVLRFISIARMNFSQS